MTNRDALNAMTDNEFAAWLSNAGYRCYETTYIYDSDGHDPYEDYTGDIDEYVLPDIDGDSPNIFYVGSCQRDILEWLHEEYGGDNYAN